MWAGMEPDEIFGGYHGRVLPEWMLQQAAEKHRCALAFGSCGDDLSIYDRSSAVLTRRDGVSVWVCNPEYGLWRYKLASTTASATAYNNQELGYPSGNAESLDEVMAVLVDFAPDVFAACQQPP